MCNTVIIPSKNKRRVFIPNLKTRRWKAERAPLNRSTVQSSLFEDDEAVRNWHALLITKNWNPNTTAEGEAVCVSCALHSGKQTPSKDQPPIDRLLVSLTLHGPRVAGGTWAPFPSSHDPVKRNSTAPDCSCLLGHAGGKLQNAIIISQRCKLRENWIAHHRIQWFLQV